MYSKKWHIRLDTQRQYDNELISMVKQDIYSNELHITLVNNGKLMNFDLATHISVIVDKADGTKVIGSGEILGNGSIKYIVDYQAISCIGIATLTLKIHSVGSVLTTTSFNIMVIEDPYAGTNSSVASSSELPVLQNLIDKHTTYVSAENARAIAEGLRVVEENTRESNEALRIVLYNNLLDLDVILRDLKITLEDTNAYVDGMESTRQSNEGLRVALYNELLGLQLILEGLKTTLEDTNSDVENNEGIRILNENARIDNDVAREQLYRTLITLHDNLIDLGIALNSARDAAITATSNANIATGNANSAATNANNISNAITQAEGLRVTAESLRVTAEGLRVTAENARKTAEQARESNYTTKINEFIAETERVEAIYPTRLTKVENDLTERKEDYVRHLNDNMPHQFRDFKNEKVYNFGFQISAEGNPQIIYEEVIE